MAQSRYTATLREHGYTPDYGASASPSELATLPSFSAERLMGRYWISWATDETGQRWKGGNWVGLEQLGFADVSLPGAKL